MYLSVAERSNDPSFSLGSNEKSISSVWGPSVDTVGCGKREGETRAFPAFGMSFGEVLVRFWPIPLEKSDLKALGK